MFKPVQDAMRQDCQRSDKHQEHHRRASTRLDPLSADRGSGHMGDGGSREDVEWDAHRLFTTVGLTPIKGRAGNEKQLLVRFNALFEGALLN